MLYKTAIENKYRNTWIHKHADETNFIYLLFVLIQYNYNIFIKYNTQKSVVKNCEDMVKMAAVIFSTLSWKTIALFYILHTEIKFAVKECYFSLTQI